MNALVLEIFKQDNRLLMSVFEREDIASTLRHSSQLCVSFEEIQKLCQEASSILNAAGNKDALKEDVEINLKKTGQLLWDQLLAKPVKNRLRAASAVDLVLFLDEELINIPWELLYDGKDFLCLKFNVGRLVRTKEQAATVQYRSLPGRLKMLILADPTSDLKSAYLEGAQIKNQFDRRRLQVSIDFKSTHIDTLYAKKNLRDYDIVHFAGHCEYDAENPRDAGWVFSDGSFTAADILAMGETSSLPALIFSNACRSAGGALGAMDAHYQAKTYSMACAFLFSGTRHYIGTIRKVDDPTSFAFAREFYNHLINGKPVGECLRLSRLELVKEYGLGVIPWTSYLLYGDPNFAFFRPKIKPVAPRLTPQKFKKLFGIFLLGLSTLSLGIYLYHWLPSLNPNTYLKAIKAQKLYYAGRNQEVVSLSKNILRENPLFLSAYPLLADTYLRLGQRAEALKVYFDYVYYSEKKEEKKNLASGYIGVGWVYYLQGDYSKAFDFYHQAVSLSQKTGDKLNEAVALRKLAVWYIDKEGYDKALELLLKSSEINRQRQQSFEHRYNLACDYFDLGWLFTDKDDFAAAKEFYNKSLELFGKLKLKNELGDYYFNLGEIYLFEKQYQKALDFYRRGLKIEEAQGNISSLASGYNMLGELYAEMDNLEEAERFFQAALSVAQQINAQPELAAIYHNLGLVYKKKGKLNKTRGYLRLAQEIYSRMDTPDYQRIKQEFIALDNPP